MMRVYYSEQKNNYIKIDNETHEIPIRKYSKRSFVLSAPRLGFASPGAVHRTE